MVKDVIYEQAIWALYGEQRNVKGFIPDAMYNIEMSRLSRKAQRDNSTYFFLLDGLDEFPLANEEVRVRSLLRLLPFGQPAFKFLITGDASKLDKFVGANVVTKAFPISGFTLGETSKYLSDLGFAEEAVTEIHQFTQKNPGRLASIRRSFSGGASLTDILSGNGSGMEFFDLEWANTDPDDALQMRILALIAHNDKARRIEEIAEMLGVTKDQVEERISGLSFVQTSSLGLGYVSEEFRAQVANKLQSLGAATSDLIIEQLLKSPDSTAALTQIPVYLERNERYDELLSYLSYDHFTKLISVAESLVPLKRQLDLGISASARMGRDRELIRLTLESASLEQLSHVLTWRAEIQARVALDDQDGAEQLLRGYR